MSLTALPSGLQPAYHPSGQIRSTAHQGLLVAGTNVNIFKNQPVKLVLGTGGAINGVTVPAGQVVLAPITAITDPIFGVFAGCEYFDVLGKPTESDYWPASQAVMANTFVTAFIWEDPAIVYTIQTDGSIAIGSPAGTPVAALEGRNGDISNFAAGSTTTGLSQCTFSSTLRATGVQGQLRIMKFDPTVLNQAYNDTYVQIQVQIARSQLANAVSLL